MQGIRYVKGQVIQIITLLELVISILTGVVLLHEPATVPVIMGAAAIGMGVIVASWSKMEKNIVG